MNFRPSKKQATSFRKALHMNIPRTTNTAWTRETGQIFIITRRSFLSAKQFQSSTKRFGGMLVRFFLQRFFFSNNVYNFKSSLRKWLRSESNLKPISKAKSWAPHHRRRSSSFRKKRKNINPKIRFLHARVSVKSAQKSLILWRVINWHNPVPGGAWKKKRGGFSRRKLTHSLLRRRRVDLFSHSVDGDEVPTWAKQRAKYFVRGISILHDMKFPLPLLSPAPRPSGGGGLYDYFRPSWSAGWRK